MSTKQAFIMVVATVLGCGRGTVFSGAETASSSQTHQTSVAARCSHNEECASGGVCVDGLCAVVCFQDADCDAGFVCTPDSLCQAAAFAPPSITAVDGNGSLDGRSGFSARRLRDRLVVHGHDLGDAEFVLARADGSQRWVLAPCASNREEVELPLAQDLEPGEYLLSAVNQAGSCSTGLTLLRGEQGPAGDTRATRTHPWLDSAITLVLRADSATPGGTLGIVVDGEERLTRVPSNDGIALVVVDSLSHTAGEPQVYSLDDAGTLASDLAALTSGQIVALVSSGHVLPLIENKAVEQALQALGASTRITELSVGQAFALVGRLGLVPGEAAERLSHDMTGGRAQLSAMALGADIIGVGAGIRGVQGLHGERGQDGRAMDMTAAMVSTARTVWMAWMAMRV